MPRSLKRFSTQTCLLVALSFAATACGDGTTAGSTAQADAVADVNGATSDLVVADAVASADTLAADAALQVCAADGDCAQPGKACLVAICLDKQCRLAILPDKAACDDGDKCTSSETCTGGQCGKGTNTCVCQKTSDCAAQEDGNLCNGQLFCDTTATPPSCKLNPATPIVCPGVNDTPCSFNTCDGKTGTCSMVSQIDGIKCEDGLSCTIEETCKSGKCTGGISICECQISTDCAKFDDGNLCNGSLYCDNTTFPFGCKINEASVVSCPSVDDTPCAKNTCTAKTGQCAVVLAADNTPCDDGDVCSSDDVCLKGQCQGGKNVCPCLKNPDCGAFEDGNLCNGTLFCNVTLGTPGCEINPATTVSCPSGSNTACSATQCVPKTGKCTPISINELGSCDDGNLCTPNDFCSKGECISSANTCDCTQDSDCSAKDDANLCNGTLFCDKSAPPFKCKVNPKTVVTCPDVGNTTCSVNTCDFKTGSCSMISIHENGGCDADGYTCTVGDACKSGVCVAGANVCTCEQQGDCLQYEDSSLCNGTLYCDKTKQPFVCLINPTTVVVCPSNNDTECLQNQCHSSNGQCSMKPVHQGQSCNGDNNLCTIGDACNGGSCEIGPNLCACTADSDCAVKEDGDLCNGTLFCDKTKAPFDCKINPATLITCPADKNSACSKNTCDGKSGKCAQKALGDDTACEDGNVCSVGDVCTGGKCVAGTDVCACESDEDCGAFDNDLCDGKLTCDKAKLPFVCKPDGKKVLCPATNSPCVKPICQPLTGFCVAVAVIEANGKACEDGDPCSVSSDCVNGKCVAKAPAVCDDNNVCTLDSCLAGVGCQIAPASAACDDSNPCTVLDACAGGVCVGALMKCDDGNPCTNDFCQAGLCKTNLLNGAGCSDGNVCTQNDACNAGSCVGTPVVCLAKNTCLAQVCEALAGCVAVDNNGKSCDDGDSCTAFDKCTGKICAGVGKNCDDGNSCTSDSCAGAVCLNLALVATPCDDGNPCTDADVCGIDGNCTGPQKLCSDDNACTFDSCQAPIGCIFIQKINGCDDGNPCTNDACDAMIGCVHQPGNEGKTCKGSTKCGDGSCGSCGLTSNFIDTAPGANDRFDGFCADALTDLYMVGSRTQGVAKSDGIIVHSDASGNFYWKKSTGTAAGADAFVAAVPTSFGAIAVGHTDKSDGKGAQGWVYAVTAAGAAKFDLALGNAGDDFLYGVAAMGSGKYLAVGSKADNGWLVAVDESGVAVDAVAPLPLVPGSNALRAIAAYPANGGWILVGDAIGDKHDGWIVRISNNFLVSSQIKLGSTGDDAFSGVSIASDGSAYAVGFSTQLDGIHPWIAKVDSNGALLWQQTLASQGGNVQFQGVASLTNGDAVAVGTGAVLVGDNSVQFPFAARFTINGALVWSGTVAENSPAAFSGVRVNGAGLQAFGRSAVVGKGDLDGWLRAFGSDGKFYCF